MKAKDTIISWERIRMILHEQDVIGQRDNMFTLEAIAQVQAEISFKAGIKEVVDWIESEDAIYRVVRKRWQAKLKEWGI